MAARFTHFMLTSVTVLASSLLCTTPQAAAPEPAKPQVVDTHGNLQHPSGTVSSITNTDNGPGSIIIKLKASAAADLINGASTQTAPVPNSVQNRLSRHGAQQTRALFAKKLSQKPGAPSAADHAPSKQGLERIYVVNVNAVGNALADLQRDPNIEYAQPNRMMHATKTRNDPYYNSAGSWGQGFDDLYGLKHINAGVAWDTQEGNGVVVAVVDTGVDRSHADIAANMWTNANEIAGNSVDDDNNGYIDDVLGWDFIGASTPAAPDNNPYDGNGHGTHVAGTIAAVGDNNAGIVGVAPKARIMAVKGLNDEGSGYEDGLALAVRYAVDNGAKVINCSWGGQGTSYIFQDVMDYARQHGATVIVAAGNDGRDAVSFTPANTRSAIVVGAINNGYGLASFSNFGPLIDVVAPGVQILSLLSNGSRMATDSNYSSRRVNQTYLQIDGTSMATPHVAGVAALLLAKQPQLGPDQVRYILRKTATDLGNSGWDTRFGFGLVNAQAVVAYNGLAPRVWGTITSPGGNSNQLFRAGTQVTVVGSANEGPTGVGSGFSNYTLSYAALVNGSPGSYTSFASINTPVNNGTLGTWNTSGIADGEYLLRLNVNSASGNHEAFAKVRIDSSIKAGWPQLTSYYKGEPNGWHTIENTGAMTFVDLDNDGKKEVVAVDGTTLKAWNADGSVRAGFPVTLSCSSSNCGFTTPVTVADLDKDNIPELVLLAQSPPWEGKPVYAYKANGSLAPGFPAGGPQDPNIPSYVARLAGYGPPTVADVDNDGEQDIVASYNTYNINYARTYVVAVGKNGQTKAGWPKSFTDTVGRPIAGDLDRDGQVEISLTRIDTANRRSYWRQYQGNGNLKQEFQIANGTDLTDPIFADMDLDGKYEAFSLFIDATTNAWRGILFDVLNGSAKSGWPVNTPNYWSGQPRLFTDMDNNGTLELVLAGGSASDPYWRSVHAYRVNATQLPEFPKLVSGHGTNGVIADNPMVDAYLSKAVNVALIHQADNNGGLWSWDERAMNLFGWPKSVPYTNFSPAASDIDNDGKVDIAIQSLDGYVYMFEEAALPGKKDGYWPTLYANNQRNSIVPTNATPTFNKVYPQVYVRGTNNNWGTSIMTLVGHNTWRIDTSFGSTSNERFKFDVYGNWATSFGDTQNDGIAEPTNVDIKITQGAGSYRITFNDLTKAYSISKQPSNNGDWRRTVIFMYGQTVTGQDMFMRGGIDWTYAKNYLGRDCVADKWLCAIPIQHNLIKTDPNRANDKNLDWYGGETGQSANIEGSPLVWTTNAWPSSWGTKKTVATDGYGEDPENSWGHHYWKLDVTMDCSKTINGWFELKSYISNGPGWESNISQAGAPYSSANHFAKCGHLNKFERGSNAVYMTPL